MSINTVWLCTTMAVHSASMVKILAGVGVSSVGVLYSGGWLFYLTEHERMAKNIVSGKFNAPYSQTVSTRP